MRDNGEIVVERDLMAPAREARGSPTSTAREAT
jgi:hypothetical protein